MMKENLKAMASYYKPYMGIFLADTFFAFLGAAVALVIPLVVRYITSEVIYWPQSEAMPMIIRLGIAMLFLVAVQFYSNYFIGNYGHVMGAKIEYDMRAKIFAHYQKLEQVGLAAPQVTYVVNRLKERGLPVRTDVTTVEEARDAILEALRQGKSPDKAGGSV